MGCSCRKDGLSDFNVKSSYGNDANVISKALSQPSVLGIGAGLGVFGTLAGIYISRKLSK